MKRIAGAVALLLLVMTAFTTRAAEQPTAAFRKACETQLAQASFGVVAKPVEVLPVVSADMRTINLFTRGSTDFSEHFDAGYTDAKRVYGLTFDQSSLLDKANGLYCSTVQSHVELGYTPISVVIADVIPPNSCSYGMVKAHEFHHVKLFQDGLGSVAANLQALLNKNPKDGIVYATSLEQAQQAHMAQLKAMEPVILASFDPIYASQKSFDSVDEYRKSLSACNGEFRKIALKAYEQNQG